MKIINQYKQGFKMGSGKDSKCYLVTKDKKTYCMKKIKVRKDEEDRIKKIEREIEIMKIAKHENIIMLEDSFRLEKDDCYVYCIITEVMRMNLAQFIKTKRNGKLKEKIAKKIFKQVLKVMEFLHLNYICHNDIKLENIMIDPDTMQIKLIDFGMSIMAQNEDQISNLNELCGTPIYLSPEKISFKDYDGTKSDVWSCGVLLYRMLNGNFPFNYSDLFELSKSICNDTPCYENNDLPISLLDKMLCKDPKNRISITIALQHEWIQNKVFNCHSMLSCSYSSIIHCNNNEEFIEKQYGTLPSSF